MKIKRLDELFDDLIDELSPIFLILKLTFLKSIYFL